MIAFIATTLAFEVTCNYKTKTDWRAIDNVYFCELKDDIESSKLKNDTVTSVTGCHLHSHYNRDVVGFRAENKTLRYFPQGLDNYFNGDKIEFIAVWSSGLKEICVNDFSPFINIRILSLWDNDIEVVKNDVFKFNLNLQYLTLGSNKIKIVDGNVFEPLQVLRTLYMGHNVCISKTATNDRAAVVEIINEIKEKCNG